MEIDLYANKTFSVRSRYFLAAVQTINTYRDLAIIDSSVYTEHDIFVSGKYSIVNITTGYPMAHFNNIKLAEQYISMFYARLADNQFLIDKQYDDTLYQIPTKKSHKAHEETLKELRKDS